MLRFKIPTICLTIPTMLAIFAVQSGLAGLLTAVSTGAGNSLVQSGIVLILSATTLVLIGLAIYSRARSTEIEDYLERLHASSRAVNWLNGFLIACFLSSISILFAFTLLEGYAQSFPSSASAVYARWLVFPGLCFVLAACEAGAWAACFLAEGKDPGQPSRRKIEIVFLALVALLAFLVGLSGLGVQGQSTLFYGFPGAPLMEWQIGLALALGGGMAWFEAFRWDRERSRRLDGWFFLAIWAGALLLWMSQPLNTGGYALPPRAPNHEVYPFSDAMSYDRLARSLSAGLGFMEAKIPPRPLYITFLAGLHLLAGLDYPVLIALQSAVLALLPAGLFLVGKNLAGRPTGLALAALAALRDVNANTAESFASNLSYSKMLLSELPTALLLVSFSWLLLRWARRGSPSPLEALLAGGLAGLAVLIRTQSLVAVPVGLLVVLLNRPQGCRSWLKGSLALLLGLVLVLSPWLVRNLQVGGGLVFDDPVSQTMVLAQRYNGIAYDAIIARQPGETDSAYTARLMELAVDGLRRNPSGIAMGAADHLVNSLAASLRILPVRASFSGPAELLRPTRPFWETPLEAFAPGQVALLLAILALSALGAADCWRRARWSGLLPLFINLGYNAWSALFFASGERFILPVDWAILLYFSAGLLSGVAKLASALRVSSPNGHSWTARLVDPLPPDLLAVGRTSLRQFGLAAVLCLAAGASIPLAEHWIRPAHSAPERSRQDQINRLASSGLDPAALARLAAREDTLVLQGLTAYPLYYGSGEGYPGIEKTGYAPSPQPRLVFFILASRETFALMNLPRAPDFFPDGAQITALGRQQKGYVQILAALVEKDGRTALWTASEGETGP